MAGRRRRRRRPLWPALIFAGLAALSGAVTFLTMTGGAPYLVPSPRNVALLLSLNLVFLVLLAGVVGRRVVRLWTERRRNLVGSQLRTHLVVLVTGVALVPTLLVGIFTVLFFDYGLQGWFGERVRTALDRSLDISEVYLDEHGRELIGDAHAMANDLGAGGAQLFADRRELQRVVELQGRLRSLSEVIVFEPGGRELANWSHWLGRSFSPTPEWAVDRARDGEIVFTADGEDGRLGVLLGIPGAHNTFIHVGRVVDARVLDRLAQVRSAVEDYRNLDDRRTHVEITFAMIYATVAALFLFTAVWVAFNLATRIADPVTSLIGAADRVSVGDLSARVEVEDDGRDEINALGHAFNRMTVRLASQRDELVGVNRELDERRRFTEAVLAGVAVGVIGLDAEDRVRLPNRQASDLLGIDLLEHLGEPLDTLVHPFREVLAEARRRPLRTVETETVFHRDGQHRTFLVRVTARTSGQATVGHVLAFTDITDLLTAERKAAWSDVARRIAHEIKNPLTPIQLAAERLSRRYLVQIRDDPDTFSLCVGTIVAQVDNLRRMVDEFSAFARMPDPVLADEDLADIVRQTAFLQDFPGGDVRLEICLPEAPGRLSCDRRQIGQALTNLIQNARQALDGRGGRVAVVLAERPDAVELVVEDDGPGFPPGIRDRLDEPYVTGKGVRGTGLGLAIVRKIVEDHGASIRFEDVAPHGARVRMVFPRGDAAEGRKPPRGM